MDLTKMSENTQLFLITRHFRLIMIFTLTTVLSVLVK